MLARARACAHETLRIAMLTLVLSFLRLYSPNEARLLSQKVLEKILVQGMLTTYQTRVDAIQTRQMTLILTTI